MNDDLEVSIYTHFLNKLQRLDREWLKLDPANSSAGVFDRQQESNFVLVCVWVRKQVLLDKTQINSQTMNFTNKDF